MNLVSIVICKNVSFINWFSTHLLVRIHFTIQSNGLKVKCCQSFFEIRFHKMIILQKYGINSLSTIDTYALVTLFVTRKVCKCICSLIFLLHISNLKYFTIWWKCSWSIFVTHCLYFVVCNNKNLYKSIVESLSILHDAKYYLFLHYFKEKNAYHVCCLPKGRKFKPHNAMKIWSFD